MLVLQRKIGGKIHIGDDITVTVVESRDGRVTLGIDAPRTTKAYRDEILPHDHPAARKGGER